MCGCENFERVIVERVIGRAVITDLLACVECRCVYFSPLPKAAPPGPAARAHAASAGVPPGEAWAPSNGPLESTWGMMPPGSPRREETPEERERLMEAVRRANKSKHKGRRG